MKKHLFLFCAGAALSSNCVFAQVQLVKDVNTGSAMNNSNPAYFLTVGSTTYFSATDGNNGYEVWKSDGTAAGTVMLKDIGPGTTGGGTGTRMVAIGSTVYFTANDGSTGTELWKTDGTAAGTVMVKDIYSGPNSSAPMNLVVMNGNLYFTANDGTNGTELWKSDGTTSGTTLVKDINPGSAASNPNLYVFGNLLYFSATDGTNGYELWKSDGSTLGTSLIKDIYVGVGNSSPNFFVQLGSTIYFSANDGSTGAELWKTNGTSIGTSLVKDIYSGANGGMPFTGLVVYNNALYFSARDGVNGFELWTSNGTSAGTVLVKDVNAGAADGMSMTPIVSNNIMFFAGTTVAAGAELWISDGTTAGTGLVKDIYAGSTGSSIYTQGMADINGTLYFAADAGTTGRELWRSDGTSGGTVLVKDIWPGSSQSLPVNFGAASGFFLFRANNGTNGEELWKSDGSTAGTILLKNIYPDVEDASINEIVAAGSNAFFRAYNSTVGEEVWFSDGTSAGTISPKDINAGTMGCNPRYLEAIGNKVYFQAYEPVNGSELWVSDGTLAGTSLVKNIDAGSSGSNPESIVNVNDTLFFYAYQAGTGSELWKSDGTTAGTVLVKDVEPGGGGSPWSGEIKNMNGTCYFAPQTSANGPEPWVSKGTTASSFLLKDIRPVVGSDVNNFTYCNGFVYFGANDGTNGYELWKSDGTTAGTTLVKDIRAGSSNGLISYYNNSCYSSCMLDMAATSNLVFFIADDGSGSGGELWRSDGTSAGTFMVKDIYPGSIGSSPAKLLGIGTTLYFTASDGANGVELWKSDGTTAGTVMVSDINPGSASSAPDQLCNFGGKLFFSASDGTYGTELWTSQGTASTTARVSDVYPGAGSCTPTLLTATPTRLFFAANDGVIGRELYKLDMPASLQSSGTFTNVTCNGLSNGAIDLSVTGGTAPFTYAWSNAATSQDLSGIAAGVYSVTVTDSWGWTSVSSFTVTEPAVLSAGSFTVTNVTCNGGTDGSIAVTVTGGTPSYNYFWTPSAPTNVGAGTYSLQVTDAMGCMTTFSATISQPAALSGSTQVNDAACFGSANGNATVNMSVGVSPYTYQWDVNTGSQTAQMATSLAAGSYSVLVTDNDGCTITFSVTVNQPSALASSTGSSPDTCGLATGSATVTSTSGGTPPYNYAWSGGGAGSVKSNLVSGTHTVTITDNKGCVMTNTVVVSSVAHEPIPICLVTVDSTSTNNIVYWDKTTYPSVDSFIVYREVSTGIYKRIGAVPMSALSQFEDTARSVGPANGDPNIGSYRYKLQIRDVCGNYSAKSPYHNTVYFVDNQNGTFTWNTYLVEGMGSTPVVNFNLLRDTLYNGNWAVIGTVAGTQTTLNDPNYATYQATADWRVEATGFNCTPTLRYGNNTIQGTIVKSKSNITNNRVVSVKNFNSTDGISVYPNPNNGTFTVELKGEGQQVMVYSAEGKLVFSELMRGSRQTFSAHSLAKGVYNLVVKSSHGLANHKLVIL
jgi:trimeric autotransporter adhesin